MSNSMKSCSPAAGEVWGYERPGWIQEASSVAAGGSEGGL